MLGEELGVMLMKELGYGKDYQYAHDVPDAYLPQRYLPDALEGSTFYEPGTFGFERDIAKRMAWWRELSARVRDSGQARQHGADDDPNAPDPAG